MATREVTVALDPIDAIFVVAALAEVEDRWKGPEWVPSPSTRAERVRRVREAIEQAVYGAVGK